MELSKDYTNYKWAYKEKAPQNDLEHLYVSCGYTIKEIAKTLNSTPSTVLRWLQFYNIKKPSSKVDAPELTQEMLNSIDWSKVSRNFLKEPWTKLDTPIEEDFRYFYITLNWSASDIALLLGRSISRVQAILKQLGIKKSQELHNESRDKLNLRRYGVKYPQASESALKKKEETNLNKYGVKSLLQNNSFKEQSMLNKYGVMHALEDSEIMSKMMENNTKKYGSPYTVTTKEVQGKIKNTTIKRYGVGNVFKLHKFQEKAVATREAKYGVKYYAQGHIQHIEDMNKEYWEENFHDEKLDAFDIIKCANYHNISLCTVSVKLKEFNITMRPKYSSVNEFEIINYIKQLNVSVVHKDRKVINPLEIDVYIPEKKLGIEFDGLSFHSSGESSCELDRGISSNYHLNKTKSCSDKGVQLFHIFENEWLDPIKKDIWKSMISNKLGQSQRIYARKTIVKEIKSAEAMQFCNENHLQGGVTSSVQLGLYTKDNTLVAVMTFNKPRFNKGYNWELIRYCCRKNYTVVGGASKLLSYFRKHYSGSIISYANRRWSNGSLYEHLGFKLINESVPNYFYFETKNGFLPKDMILHSRIEFQKHKLKDKLEVFDESLTEKQNMFMNGYRIIYDCGNLVYILD